MVEIKDTELVFSFPDVDEEATLRIHFCAVNSSEDRVHIKDSAGGGVQLATIGRVVMYLQPDVVRRDLPYRSARYPFAILVSVRGKNSITGEVSTILTRSPQNYFATPPQGGIDGYFLGGQVIPFRVAAEAPENRTRLEIKVFPMKSAAFAYFEHQLKLVPGPGPMISGVTLMHGGERQCEPIYEDLCSIGDWDRSREERAVVWLSDGN